MHVIMKEKNNKEIKKLRRNHKVIFLSNQIRMFNKGKYHIIFTDIISIVRFLCQLDVNNSQLPAGVQEVCSQDRLSKVLGHLGYNSQ